MTSNKLPPPLVIRVPCPHEPPIAPIKPTTSSARVGMRFRARRAARHAHTRQPRELPETAEFSASVGMAPRRSSASCMILPLIAALLLSVSASAQTPPPPPGLEGVGIEQKLGAHVPPNLTFTDESGQTIHLSDYFGARPIVLTPVYYRCPGLCTMTLNDLTRSMNGLTESVGRDFDVITFSFDPREKPALAADKKHQYIRHYGRPTADAGWHFLTGNESSIRELTQAIGFSYRYDAANDVYAHAAGVVVLTPDGTVSRYFLGTVPAVDLKEALRDAGAARVAATPAEQVFLYCFHYDPATGKYGLIISRALRVMGVITVLLVAGLVGWSLRRERHRTAARLHSAAEVHR
jgi:protein SCO1